MRTLALLAALLVGVSACGSSPEDTESRTLKVLTNQERKQIEELDNTNTKAVVANGYRAVGTYDRQEIQGGTSAHILFANCPANQAWEECARTQPTAEDPHFFITSSQLDNTVKIGAVGWWRFSTVNSLPLDCDTMTPMNAFTVAQVPLALKHFIDTQNNPISGLKEIDFPENPNPNGPSGMGKKVEWHCRQP